MHNLSKELPRSPMLMLECAVAQKKLTDSLLPSYSTHTIYVVAPSRKTPAARLTAAVPYVLYTGLPMTVMLSTVGAAVKHGATHLTQRSVQYWLKPSLASSPNLLAQLQS